MQDLSRNQPGFQIPPTPRQIREACEEIQAGWSNRVRRKRSTIKPVPYTIPEVDATNNSKPGQSRKVPVALESRI